MKVAVIGSRSIASADLKRYIPPDATVIISGGAVGVDALAEKYADERGLKKLIFYPDYELYGKSAPLIRNKLIVDSADLVIAVWDGESRGTEFTISYAKRRNVPCEIYIV
ncbi:MAG: DUF2493 domain-containing protein [Clostridia bacterium]|nr:DUF2493 domain-containing protein [Clostridia bacterium]MBQ5837623.1 DUF2493 domain-containing protein [Clostridia bacterium]